MNIIIDDLLYRCCDCGRLTEKEILSDRIVFRCYNRDCGNTWEFYK